MGLWGSSVLKFSGLLRSSFQPLIFHIHFLFSCPPEIPIMWMLAYRIYKSLKLSSLFFIPFFFLLWLGKFWALSSSSWSFLVLHLVCCWTPLLCFSVLWLYSSAPWLLLGAFKIFFFSLLEFSLCLCIVLLNLVGIFMTIILSSLSGKPLISVSLKSFSEEKRLALFGSYSYFFILLWSVLIFMHHIRQ